MPLGVDKVYVINLDRHKLRRKRITNNLSKLNINFEFIKAIDGQNSNIDYSLVNSIFYDPNGLFTKGIICCALSHRKAWKTFLDSGAKTALFLEDDVKPTIHLKNINSNQFKDELSTLNWGICWLGKYYEDITVFNQLSNYFYDNEPFLPHQYAAHSYILNRKSAQWYYNASKKIKYAADIRLEISPLKQITVNKSLFIQRHKELEKFYIKIHNEEKYKYLQEWLHHTLTDGNTGLESERKEWYNKNLPIKSKTYKDIEILGKKLNWCEFVLDI